MEGTARMKPWPPELRAWQGTWAQIRWEEDSGRQDNSVGFDKELRLYQREMGHPEGMRRMFWGRLQDRAEKVQWGQEKWADFNLQEAELQISKARCMNLRTEMAKITGVKLVQLRCRKKGHWPHCLNRYIWCCFHNSRCNRDTQEWGQGTSTTVDVQSFRNTHGGCIG